METVEVTQNAPAMSPPWARSSYSVPTPYGYQLDLGFLQYVEEIERSCRTWAASRPIQRRPRRRQARSSMPKMSPLPGMECEGWEVAQRLQLSLAELGQSNSPCVSPGNASDTELGQSLASSPLSPTPCISPGNASDPELCQSHASSPLSLAYSPAYSDEPPSSQDSGVGGAGGRLQRGARPAMGGGRSLEESRDVPDAAMETRPVQTCERGVGTDEAWGDMERELVALRHTVQTQRQRICDLEAQLRHAQQEQEVLRAQQEQEVLRAPQEQEVLRAQQEQEVLRAQQEQEELRAQQEQEVLRAQQEQEVETEPGPRFMVVNSYLGSHGNSRLRLQQVNSDSSKVQGVLGSTPRNMLLGHDQSTQTDVTGSLWETASPAMISRGSQWDNPEDDTDPTGKSRAVTASQPSPGLLRSIMKKPRRGGAPDLTAGGRKCLQFVGILNGYESTSSEEEENEEEDSSVADSDSSGGKGEAQDERSISPASGSEAESEEEKFQLSAEMHKACLILKSHLDDDISAAYGDDVRSCSRTVELEWFRTSSSKAARPAHVTGFLTAFSQLFPGLLECMVNMADLHGNTALHYSLSCSNFAVVRVLLDTGVCHVDQRNKAGYTPVMLAALATVRTAESMQVVRRLFSQGNVNAKANQTGQTALLLAVQRRRMAVVWALLDCGADVNAQDESGSSALMCACQQGSAHMVSLLLQHPHCDITLRNKDGDTALSMALAASRSDIAVLLYTHMNRNIPPTPPALHSIPSPGELGTARAIPGRPPLPRKGGTERRPPPAKTDRQHGHSSHSHLSKQQS